MSTYLVHIPGIPGSGPARTGGGTSQKTIRCTALAHGIDLPVVTKGSNRTPGYSMHGSIALWHEPDAATPKLREEAALGSNLGEVHIIRREVQGGSTVDAETIKLGQVRLGEVGMETPPNADGTGCVDLPVESFTLDYEEIVWDWRYVPATPADASASTVTGGWDTDDQTTITVIPDPPAAEE